MSNCKNCHSSEVTKNGFVRSKQRYRCKTCGYNFVEGDERTNPQTTIKRAFAVILYSLAKASYGTIANLFNVSPSTVQKWLAKEAALLSEPEIPINTRELEFDEMSGLKPTMHVVWRRLHCTNSRVQSRIMMKRLVSHSLSGYGPCLNLVSHSLSGYGPCLNCR